MIIIISVEYKGLRDFIMSEKLTIKIGVFDIPLSEEENYNQPIGLAVYDDTEEMASAIIALASHGHHGDLYSQLIEEVPDYKNMPGLYFNGVDAYGFWNSKDSLPTVSYIDRGDSRRKIAAQALHTAFIAGAHLHIPTDNSLHSMRVNNCQLEKAIIQTLT